MPDHVSGRESRGPGYNSDTIHFIEPCSTRAFSFIFGIYLKGSVVEQYIVAAIGGIIGGFIFEFIVSRGRYKYYWKCPICNDFSASASSQDIVDRVKAIHTHEEE